MTNADGSMRVAHHVAHIEGDVFVTTLVGDLRLEELMVLHEQLERSAERSGVRYHLLDLRRSGQTRPEARRYMSDVRGKSRVHFTIAFGASPALQVVVAMMQRAMALLGRRRPFVFELVVTEEEARARIDVLRAEVADSGLGGT